MEELTNPFQILSDKLDKITISLAELLKEQANKAQSIKADKKVLTTQEAARKLDSSISHIYALTSKNEIPHYKKGKKLYFDAAELDAWLLSHKVKSNAEIEKQAENYIQKNPKRKK